MANLNLDGSGREPMSAGSSDPGDRTPTVTPRTPPSHPERHTTPVPRASSPTLRGLLEAALYVTDVEAARDFYTRVFGFRTLYADGRMCALDVDGRGVLLLFLRGASAEPVQLPGGILPPHDGRGTSHLAFAIDERDLSDWRDWLHAVGVEIESEVRWERGGRSLYFRDLDGHLLEVATPGLWETY